VKYNQTVKSGGKLFNTSIKPWGKERENVTFNINRCTLPTSWKDHVIAHPFKPCFLSTIHMYFVFYRHALSTI